MSKFRELVKETQVKVCKALGISEDTYLEFFLESGIEFCAKYATYENIKDTVFRNMLKNSKEYWLWYEKRHNSIDRGFLIHAPHMTAINKNRLLTIYKGMHDRSILYPSDNLVTEIIKEMREYETR